jgi:acetyl-CoA acetyltransferase
MLNLHGDEEWEEPFGLHGMVTPYALLAQRYLHDYGATPLDFAEVAVLTRRHALNNDNAQMTKPISLEDHQQSRPISSPLRLLDCSLVSDGGGALVLMSRDRARHLGLPYVSVTSLAMRATHGSIMQAPDIAGLAVSEAANDAFDAAGHGPEDMQVALVHDAFTVSVLLSLEALGFCGPGQAGAYIRSGKAAMGGSCTLNPHGGLLSQGHIGGMLHVTEAVHQLKGTAGRRQVENVRRAVVSGNGGVFSVCGVMVMEAA